MHVRVVYEIRGGHVHCAVFTARVASVTHAKSGDLVFAIGQWSEVQRWFIRAGTEIRRKGELTDDPPAG